jgi:hypothetical protein
LPVEIYADELPRWDDVYRILCEVHPDLGGGGLRPMTSDEKSALDTGDVSFGAPDPTQIPDLYTDGPTREQRNPLYENLAHIGFEQIRVYLLPPIDSNTLARLRGDAAVAATTTTTKPDTQRWQVSVSGYELKEMDPYWDVTHGRFWGHVRFDYNLQAEVVLHKQDGKLLIRSGKVTFADVQVTPTYGPDGAWKIDTNLSCKQCRRIRPGRRVTGEVFGDDLRLFWGIARPNVRVYGQLLLPCKPEPVCSREGYGYYESREFISRVNETLLPLTGGAVSSPPVVTPQGMRRLDFTITMLRLDG